MKPAIVFDETTAAPPTGQYAANSTDIFLNLFVNGVIGGNGKGQASWVYPTPDLVLRYESAGRFYELYETMEDTDPHYYAILDTRKNAILGKPWVIVPSERDPRAEEHADFIRLVLASIPALKDSFYEMLDAMGKGWKACEILWDTMPLTMMDGTVEQKVMIKEIKGRPQRRLVSALEGRLRV